MPRSSAHLESAYIPTADCQSQFARGGIDSLFCTSRRSDVGRSTSWPPTPMPPKNGVRFDERREFAQQPATKPVTEHRETPLQIIRSGRAVQPRLKTPAQLRFEHPISLRAGRAITSIARVRAIPPASPATSVTESPATPALTDVVFGQCGPGSEAAVGLSMATVFFCREDCITIWPPPLSAAISPIR
jgi:hypothetical protein